ncbi:tetratricopeptide repeat protein, partial [Geitlerinema sp. P-1104]|uniref:tetratricopeptide repeat protein n=1 Tax=Geitlerinema sp. P-1104 TaxID=2546230 RepID=UPI0014769622
MANGGKLLRVMVLTALWLSAVEGVMAAGRRQIPLPNQGISGELWPLSDLDRNSRASSLEMEKYPPQPTLAQADLRLSEANRLLDLGLEKFNRSQFQAAIASWERALELYRAVGDRPGEVHALENLGNVYSSLGQYERAIDFYQQQRAIAHEISDSAGEVRALNNLGVAYRNLGQYDRTLEQYGQAVVLFNELVAPSETAALLEVEWQLEDGDEVLQDGSLYDLHTFEGQAGQFLEIRLNSDDFDAYLILFSPDGEQVAEDDDGGEGLNSLISIQLPQTGRYSVIANAHDASGRGRYRLTVAVISPEDYQRGQERASARAEADQLLQQGIQQFNRSQFREALDSWERALELYRAVGDRPGEGRVLGNLGNAYNSLGQYERAIDFYQRILVLFRALPDRAGEGNALGNLGNAYRKLGQYERAIDFHEQALVIFREIIARAEEGLTLGNLGNAYDSLGQYERAINFHEQALAIAREISNRLGEGNALGNLGNAYNSLGQSDRALEQYGQAVALFNELGARTEEALFLSNIGTLLNNQGQPELAIIFLKASVEVREAIRGNLRGLDTDLEQSFTDTVADSYRLLADLLLQQNRILEAQRVLDLLKIQELDDYLQEVQRNSRTASGIDYLRP